MLALDENHSGTPEIHRECNRLGICYKKMEECGLQPGTADEDVLRVVSGRGYILLGTDKAIRRNRLEREQALASGARQFVFTNNQMSGKEMARALRRAMPKLAQIVAQEPAPFIASVGKNGDVRLVMDHEGRNGAEIAALVRRE